MILNTRFTRFDNLFKFVKSTGIALFSLIALNSFAQSGTILINAGSVPVSSATKFPIWLPGGGSQTINIGANVTSISGILYNITPSTAGGNIMTVNSVVYITSSTPIAAGTALKVEGILFATTSSSTSSTWNVGGNTAPSSPVIGSTDNSAVSIQSGTGTLGLGADASAKTINIGNTVSGTNINENTGGAYTLTGVAASTYSIGVNTTTGSIGIGGSLTSGSISLGASGQTGPITIGTGSTPINIGGTTSTTAIGHNATIAGALSVGSTETVTGLVTQNGGLTEIGVASINGTGSATTTIGNPGSATTVGGTETVTGLVTQNGGLTETGAASINGTGSAATTIGNASSATTVGGALSVTGNLAKINGATYTWPTSSTSNPGYVLTNNGSGTLTWSSIMGAPETSGSTPGATSASANSATWNSPGAYIATVPSGVTQITVDMAGGQGGTGNTTNSSYSIGGYGGRMMASYPVTPGSTIYLSVGGAGGNWGAATGGGGGYLNDANGGTGGTYTASGPYYGGGGGGASDIRIGGTALSNRVLVAGGGGGGGGDDAGNNSDQGGPGGASTAATGAGFTNFVQNGSRTACGIATGGGGTTSGPGAAGCWTGYCTQSAGGSGYGGASNNCADAGGGGGGGYYGGGGGDWSGGGGGANYANGTAISPVSSAAYQGSSWFNAPLNGYVTIYWH